MSEQIRFQSVLITGQQQQVSRLQTQQPVSPNDGFDNLAYSTSNYFVQNNLPVSYEAQKQTSYVQQVNASNNNQMKSNDQITAKHSITQKISMNSKQQRQKINNDSDSDNDDGIFCGVRTETKPKSMQTDLPVEQTTRADSNYGICQIF